MIRRCLAPAPIHYGGLVGPPFWQRSDHNRWCTRNNTFSTSPQARLMDTTGFTETQLQVREAVGHICARFPSSYWQQHDEDAQDPADFHAALAKDGWLGIALPENLGGSGLGIVEAVTMMQTITESGAGMAGAQAVHANLYATQPLARFGSPAMLRRIVPDIVSGARRACFGVTEPNAGLDTRSLRTTASRQPDGSFRVSGQKIWITCAQVASLMILLARTAPSSSDSPTTENLDSERNRQSRGSGGLSLFCIDLDRSKPGLTMRRIKKMGGRAVDANEVFFDGYSIPAESLVGGEGAGFRAVLHGMNAERCLLAGEALGLGYAALERAGRYARERVVFGRPIGQNQAVAHPLADVYMRLEAAKLATYHAARMYDTAAAAAAAEGGGTSSSPVSMETLGVACNSAKYLAAEAAFVACERAVMAHGGMGYAVEYDVERWFRECLVPRIAPVSREMILNYISEKVLKLPRSY